MARLDCVTPEHSKSSKRSHYVASAPGSQLQLCDHGRAEQCRSIFAEPAFGEVADEYLAGIKYFFEIIATL